MRLRRDTMNSSLKKKSFDWLNQCGARGGALDYPPSTKQHVTDPSNKLWLTDCKNKNWYNINIKKWYNINITRTLNHKDRYLLVRQYMSDKNSYGNLQSWLASPVNQDPLSVKSQGQLYCRTRQDLSQTKEPPLMETGYTDTTITARETLTDPTSSRSTGTGGNMSIQPAGKKFYRVSGREIKSSTCKIPLK